MKRSLRRDIRLLQLWALASGGMLILLAATGFTQGQPRGTRFEEISVERINIVEQDGRVRFVLANGARQADAVLDGQVLAPGRNRPAGMIFFNELGNEVGGLTFSGRQRDGRYDATGSLTFDQWRQDQTIALQYVDQNGQRRAGLAVIDRPNTSLAARVNLTEKRRTASTDADRTAIDREIAALGPQDVPRMFVGKNVEGSATLVLSDPQGRQRLLLSVDTGGKPSIRFFDESGRTVREIVP
jgi:hypothetical protein